MKNKNNSLVSIIVPVYNVEKYLEECLASISHQSYQNFEAIIVDDGSTDGSYNKAINYCKNDERFLVVSKPNGGLASARNAGIEISKGNIICFVDSDDYISENFVEVLLNCIVNEGADIAVCARYNVYQNKKNAVFDHDSLQFWSGRECVKRMLSWNGLDGSVCDKMFLRSAFDKIRFKQGAICEDLPVTANIFAEARLVVHAGQPLYFYRQRSGSISSVNFSLNKITIIQSVDEIKAVIRAKFPELLASADVFILHHLLYLFSCYIRTKELENPDRKGFEVIRRRFLGLTSVFFSMPGNRRLIKKILIYMIILLRLQDVVRFLNTKTRILLGC